MKLRINRSVLFVGSFPNPITGQSLALQKAWEGYPFLKYRLDNSFNNLQNRNKLIRPFSIGFRYVAVFFLTIGILISKRPDIVYVSISRTLVGSLKDLPVLIFSNFFGIPVVCHLHGADFLFFFNSIPTFIKPFYIYIYKNVSMYIVLTVGMKDEIKSALNNNMKVCVISNFYDSILDEAQVNELLVSTSYKIEITYLSNLLYSKGILHLIDAFINLNNQMNNQFKLNIAGKLMSDNFMNEYELSSRFKEKIAGLSDISYLGIVTGKDKYELLKKSDIFVLPTFYPTEAQPLAILEALRMGCYIITTHHNYIPEIVNSNNGELIEPNSIKAIEKAIRHYTCLKPDLCKEFALNNIVYAIENFSLVKYQSELNFLFKSI